MAGIPEEYLKADEETKKKPIIAHTCERVSKSFNYQHEIKNI